jgi:hypothetical protein
LFAYLNRFLFFSLYVGFVSHLALLTEAEKRLIYEGWMRTKSNENRKKTAALTKKQLRQKQEQEFKEMLGELGTKLTHNTKFEQIQELCKDDQRFFSLFLIPFSVSITCLKSFFCCLFCFLLVF